LYIKNKFDQEIVSLLKKLLP